jgi:mitogen-activated protein kinase kinase kinase 13
LRLRKDELVELYAAAGLTDDAEVLTKQDIVEAIVAARDEIAELPPSSPPGRDGGDSSEYSSDDGNVAGDEEFGVDNNLPGLRRRATINGLGRTNVRPPQNRCLSLGHIQSDPRTFEGKKAPRVNGEVNGR